MLFFRQGKDEKGSEMYKSEKCSLKACKLLGSLLNMQICDKVVAVVVVAA